MCPSTLKHTWLCVPEQKGGVLQNTWVGSQTSHSFVFHIQFLGRNALNKNIPKPPTASANIRGTLVGSMSSIMLFLSLLPPSDLPPPMSSRTRLLILSNWCITCRWLRAIPSICIIVSSYTHLINQSICEWTT